MDNGNYDDFDFYEPGYEPRSDEYEISATERLAKFFKKFKNSVFTTKQLQVLFESHYFHWVTYRALCNLEKDGLIKRTTQKFYGIEAEVRYHRSNRYHKRKTKKLMEIIKEYSTENVSWSCGIEANRLFYISLTERNFRYLGKDTNEFKGKKWIQTDHNFDYILERDGIVYGIEIKNTFDYIDKDEMKTKIEICKYLGIKPLFIMRWAPQSYMNDILNAGGFGLLFETKIFPLALKSLVEKINKEQYLPYKDDKLVLKNGKVRKICDTPKAIPDGIIDRFENWHKKHANSE
jgi:DNA-binding transcriptional regulator YhcF (GntR family)